ncbi:MAG: crotonase/enoyl-CoA hydratase family protein [Gammaproteobacteria bacterium]|nr:crotonase/enoyl-CoA hydratase family protein [Gammaproteobacteria bacterium]
MLPRYETLDLSVENHVATVALNRPDKANSMNLAMWNELQACFEYLDEEPSVRAVVLAGNGKHFCAGLDLAMFGDLTQEIADPARRAEQLRKTILRLQGNLNAIENCRVPVLAAIHNTCIGGGVDMTCCADMRYASADAFFSIREIDIGMTADVGTLQRLPRIIPDGVVRELAYTGRNMDADEACSMGFINRVFEDRETLLREVTAIAHRIAEKSPLAVRGSKEMLLYSRDHSVAEGLNYIATWNAGMMSQLDLQEGVLAQMEKRKAHYED